jgi:DEAD/DEAH box helicase domain-containing protein
MAFDPMVFLNGLARQRGYQGQLVHVNQVPARPARYGQLATPLSDPVAAALKAGGVDRLYVHQAAAINAALAGQNVVVATSTASGKTLCFHVPVLEALARDPLARALCLYPTKALAQDQIGKWQAFVSGAAGAILNAEAATYDGDTPPASRGPIRKRVRVVLSNPDMLHVGILPNHALWASFFRHLKFVVIDEAHSYRGVFGSQVACVLRRLRRVCALYGNAPQFMATSATIANPAEHFELLTGLKATIVDDDGSPHGPRTFALWDPPFLDRARTARRSANREASDLFVALVGSGVRTIAFARARVAAELLLRYAREQLRARSPQLADRIAAYRAGYLPGDRRKIESDLFHGRLVGVTATSALELGIDVGGLEAALLVGYPGTIASMWQQAGRAGRGQAAALAVLVAMDNPLDQFFMRHPASLLGRSHEHALIDPDNIYILELHLPCAAQEAPLVVAGEEGSRLAAKDDRTLFGAGFAEAVAALETSDILRPMPGWGKQGQRWVFPGSGHPAQAVALRDAQGDRFAVLNASNGYALLEELSTSQAAFRVHPGAIYMHQGESYQVTEFDLAQHRAVVTRAAVDYYTQARELSDVRIVRSLRHVQLPTTTAYLGRVRVRSQVVGYRRLHQFTEAVEGDESLDLPANQFETAALWWDIPENVPLELARRGWDFFGGLHAAEHASIGILPLFAMCDRWDIGGLSTPRHPDTGVPQIFIYDGFPGGVGIAEKGFELLGQLWSAALDAIRGCPCEDGCPSCIQSPKCGNNNHPLDKRAAEFILGQLISGH